MGFNTPILVINDGLEQLRKNPEEFVEGIFEKLHDGGTVGVGNHANPVQVMQSQHADVFRLFASQANLMVELSEYSRETERLVERMGAEWVQNYIDRARALLDGLERSLS